MFDSLHVAVAVSQPLLSDVSDFAPFFVPADVRDASEICMKLLPAVHASGKCFMVGHPANRVDSGERGAVATLRVHFDGVVGDAPETSLR